MPGVLVAVLLVASLLLAHFSMRQHPMPAKRPLNVDEGLPLPEVGQASTVFSLTALFGAYLGIYVLLGWPALLGLAAGTTSGLVFVRGWFQRRPSRSFETFLYGLFVGRHQNGLVFGLFVAAVQCGFAASELLILRELVRSIIGLPPQYATLASVGLGLIGYFYVLFGGYLAVFRTDVLQFVFVLTMGALLVAGTPAAAGGLALWPRDGYWTAPFPAGPATTALYHSCVAAVMGFAFIVASPDAWKRVFLVSKSRSRGRFIGFAVAGVLPFALLMPIVSRIPSVPDGPTSLGAIFGPLIASDLIFVGLSLGLVCSFLSAFDGALLGAVQLGLLVRRAEAGLGNETPRFHWLMVVTLLVVVCLFFAMLSLAANPYLLASVLLGPYALIAGIQLGAFGTPNKTAPGLLLWVVPGGLVAWSVILSLGPSISAAPSTFQLNVVPAGVGLCLLAGLVCWAGGRIGVRNV